MSGLPIIIINTIGIRVIVMFIIIRIIITTIDTTAPDAPTITTASLVTNDTTPTITGKAEAKSTVKLLNGDVVIGTATAANNRNFSITPSAALAEGVYSLRVTATDAAGNVSEKSAPVSVTIDTTARVGGTCPLSPDTTDSPLRG